MALLLLYGVGFAGAPFLLLALKRTPLYWLPSVALVVIAGIVYAAGIVTPRSGGEAAPGARGLDVTGNLIVSVAAFAMLAYALICFWISRRLHLAPPAAPPAVELPTATVVNDPARR